MATSFGCCVLEPEDEHTGKHRPFLILTIIIATVSYGLLLIMNIVGEYAGIYSRDVNKISDEYPVDLALSADVLTLWTFIYVWHFIIFIYCIVSIFRKTSLQKPVYTSPTLLSFFFFGYLTVSYLLLTGWLFLWDRLLIAPAVVFMFVIAGCFYLSLVVSYRKLNHYSKKLTRARRTKEMWMIIVIVQNGVALFAGWTTVIFYLNLAVCLVYWNVLAAMSSLICLCIFAVHFISFALTDLTIFHKFTKYVLTPYIAIAVALAGMLLKNWRADSVNAIFVAVFLAFVVICAIIKSIRMLIHIVRANRKVTPPSITISTVTNSTVTNGNSTDYPTTNETSFSSDNDIEIDEIIPVIVTNPVADTPVERREPLATVSEEPEHPLPERNLFLSEFVLYN
ncbi:uncharacterized protein LOC126820358 [Patella vulgata]|uniref:uncharacterized protein LOC126820358 n=1 Tax=Patella vulgata TaxID=6465 RepID=UPI00217FC2E7|nr:uncharacterized protein LOC126820358 [Patella vulgata]